MSLPTLDGTLHRGCGGRYASHTETVTVRLSEIPLPGLREALQQMPSGARWEVAIPGKLAHGDSIEKAGPMANQVVLFNIKLVNVGPVVAAPTQQQGAAQPRN